MVADMAKNKPGRPKKADSKRTLGVDRHADPRKAFHAPQSLFDALAKCIAETKPLPSEAAVLRLALEEYLERRGYWPPKES